VNPFYRVPFFRAPVVEGGLAVDFKLYLISDRKVMKGPLVEAVSLALAGGVRAVQLREKDLLIRELLALAQELRALTRQFDAKLFINDRVDVAMAVDADGVHLGTRSMPPSAVRKIIGKRRFIGVSTHSLDEARSAAYQGADFITFGPIYETPAKIHYGPPVGIDAIKYVKESINIPVFAIGGIASGNLAPILKAGANGVAMISAILAAKDIRKAAKHVIDSISLVEKIICDECSPR
jgi:thiamine-phosphate pyrophosphorylase